MTVYNCLTSWFVMIILTNQQNNMFCLCINFRIPEYIVVISFFPYLKISCQALKSKLCLSKSYMLKSWTLRFDVVNCLYFPLVGCADERKGHFNVLLQFLPGIHKIWIPVHGHTMVELCDFFFYCFSGDTEGPYYIIHKTWENKHSFPLLW